MCSKVRERAVTRIIEVTNTAVPARTDRLAKIGGAGSGGRRVRPKSHARIVRHDRVVDAEITSDLLTYPI